MGETPGSPTVSMKLQRIAEQAQRYPSSRARDSKVMRQTGCRLFG
jgi:hypothetical protein